MNTLITEDGLDVARQWVGDLSELRGSTIAISGATGLIGQHVVALLLGLSEVHDLGLTVIAMGRSLTRLESVFSRTEDYPNLTLMEADISTPGSWPTQATHLIHAASPATPLLFATDPLGVVRANVLGTLTAIDCATESGAYLSLVSTMEVYGSIPGADDAGDIEIAEDALGLVNPLDVRSAYPESKRLCENLMVDAAAQRHVSGDIVRVSHTYGPGAADDDNRVQVQFVKQAVSGQPIVLKSDGTLRRHYTYATDSASAIVAIMATRAQRSTPQAFNVADNSSRVSIRELAQRALVAAGRQPDELVIDIDRPSDQLWSTMRGATFLDTSKLEALGWRPLFSLEKGLSRMVESLGGQLAIKNTTGESSGKK
ncbi:MAG: NAD-dependent epimerase/dehydratase family protein [Propionibacteriaceae bacterium]|nr:NAD-dependent epimerase/dehydratase family protein [Propionibacteriaceae bacterium]